MNNIIKYVWYLIIPLLCLTPIIWLWGKSNVLINGLDTNFPLDPIIWFQRRFYVWNNISNAGSDFSSSIAGLFFHLVQFVPFKLGFSLQQTEIFSLVFWFTLIVSSSFFLAKTLFPKKPLPQLVLTCLYSFNIYLFNTWENVKVTNLSLVASIPLAISVLILLEKDKISYLKASIIFVIVGIILTGSGINPAYFITFYLTIFIFFISQLIFNFNKKLFYKRIKDFLLLTILVTIINLFWIIPTTSFIFRNISSSNSINNLGFSDWVESLSINSSVLNIIRLQGAWDWYAFDENGLPYYIPYSTMYASNIIFILFSFLIPAFAIAALIVKDKNKDSIYITFSLILLVGIFLGSGTHPPSGPLFRFLMNNLPFFSLFRSPWYIFTPMIILALASLASLFVDSLLERVKRININYYRIVSIFICIFIFTNLIYSYPLVTGKIFRPTRENGFYLTFPNYVFEAKNWLNSQNIDGRIISFPDDKIEVFKWGYRGVDSILHLLVNNEVLFSPLNTQDSQIGVLIDQLYLNIKKGQLEAVKSLAIKLNVSMIFEKKDQDSFIMNLPDIFSNLPKASFGQWNFYNLFSNEQLSKVYIPSQIFLTQTNSQVGNLISVLNKEDVLLNQDDNEVKNISEIKDNSGLLIKSENSQVYAYKDFEKSNYKIGNNLKPKDLSEVSFNFEIPQDELYQPILERYKLEDFGIDPNGDLIISYDNKITTWIVDKTTDSYVFYKSLNLIQGKHKIKIELKNNNLVKDLEETGQIDSSDYNNMQNLFDTDGSIFLKNQSNKDISFYIKVQPFDVMSDYVVELEYKHLYGSAPKIILTQDKDITIIKMDLEQLPLSPEWDIFSFYYHPHDSNTSLKISLLSSFYPGSSLGTKVAYRNLKLTKLFSNNLLFMKLPKIKLLDKPVVSYKKISPVEYNGDIKNIKNNFIFVFSENYSPYWKMIIYDSNNHVLNIKPSHFSANFYANAWFLPVTSDIYHFKILYEPQDLFKTGLIISIFGAMFILIILYVKRV